MHLVGFITNKFVTMQHGHMDVKKGETLKVCAERISQYGLQVLIWQLYLFVSGLLEWVKCMEGTVETNVKIVFWNGLNAWREL